MPPRLRARCRSFKLGGSILPTGVRRYRSSPHDYSMSQPSTMPRPFAWFTMASTAHMRIVPTSDRWYCSTGSDFGGRLGAFGPIYKQIYKQMRWLYALSGFVCVGLGYVGIIVPGMPSTVFFLIALWAFKKSSPKFETWLLTKSPARDFLRQWSEDRSMSRKGKRVCLTALWLCIAISMGIFIATGKHWLYPVVLAAVALGVTVYISQIKTAERRCSRPDLQDSCLERVGGLSS